MFYISEITIVVLQRFALIVICSLIVGFNRGKMNQFAGLKTHLFVGVGAGLSFLVPYVFYLESEMYIMDPFRLSAQVISGIGFLGAGTIIKSGKSIKGLTTAAGLWTTAIIAIAIATGAYIISIISTILIYFILRYSYKIDITRKYSTLNLIMMIKNMDENLEVIDKFMKMNTVLQKNYTILEYIDDGKETLTMIKYEIVHRQTGITTNDIIKKLSKFDCITKIEVITEMERI